MFFINMIKYCTESAIRLPTKLYYTMLMGQISPPEIKHVRYQYPKTEAEQEAFDFSAFRDVVKALPQDKFPKFYQNQVCNFTREMLVPPELESKSNKRTDEKDAGKTEDRYCRTCKCKHKQGEHTDEGKKRYAAKQKANREASKEKEVTKRRTKLWS